MAKRPPSKSPGKTSLRDEIAASGETPIDAVRQALQTDQVDRRYLGREFLTWLIYYTDDAHGDGRFSDDQGASFQIKPGGRITLKALGEGAGEIMAKGAAPAQMADVRYAIAGGLTVREAELLFIDGDRTWQATLTAEQFDLKRVKLPELLTESDFERAIERLDLVDQLDAMLLTAYAAFLQRRLQPAWEASDVGQLKAWLAVSILEPHTTLEGVLQELGEAEAAAVVEPAVAAPRRAARRRDAPPN